MTGLLFALGEIVAPRSCVSCGCRGAQVWCRPCTAIAATYRWRDPPPSLPGLEAVSVGHRYQGIVADTIVAGKLGGRHAIWRPLGRRLGRHAGLDVIVPVPTEPRRRRQRGFDHTQLLGAGLADVTGLPLLPAIAARRGAADRGRVNASDDAAETVDGVPWLVTSSLRGAHVVIVDDVITTGTTLVGVAAACREAGAVRVVAAVVSAAPGHAT